MNKLLLIITYLCCMHVLLHAETPAYVTETNTTYQDRLYTTISTTQLHASLKNADAVIDKMIEDLINDPESLFDNVLEGLGTQGKGKDAFLIEYKGYDYDAENGIFTGTLDILVNEKKLANVDFTGKLIRTKVNGKSSVASFELLGNNPVVKQAKGIITIQKIDSSTVSLYQEAYFKFSWFFNLFFSMKNYKSVAEWRLDKFQQNICREILMRE